MKIINKRNLLILLGLILQFMAVSSVFAETENDYVSVSTATSYVKDYSNNTFRKLDNFRDKFNIDDPLTACKIFYDFSGPCVNQGATAVLDYLELSHNNHRLYGDQIVANLFTPMKFKLYLPPGTININLRSYLQPNGANETNVVAAARIGALPEVPDEYLQNLDTFVIDNSNGADETRNFEIMLEEGNPTIFKRTVSDVFDMASGGSGSDLKQPLTQGQWLYIRILKREVNGISKLQFNVKVDKEIYANWYRSAPFDANGEPLSSADQQNTTTADNPTDNGNETSQDTSENGTEIEQVEVEGVQAAATNIDNGVYGTGSGSEDTDNNTDNTNVSLPGLANDEETGQSGETQAAEDTQNTDINLPGLSDDAADTVETGTEIVVDTIGADYVSVSKATTYIKNIETNTFHAYNNFRDKFNIYDPLTACKIFYDFSGPCINQGATANLDYVELSNNNHILVGDSIVSTLFTPEKFKLYLPPGTININLRSYLQPNGLNETNVVAAARIGALPDVPDAYIQNLDVFLIDETNGADETANFKLMLQEGNPTIYKRTVSDVFDLASGGSGSDLEQPLTEGKWLYVWILKREVNGISKLQFNVKVNKEMYAAWYQSDPFDSDGTPVKHTIPGYEVSQPVVEDEPVAEGQIDGAEQNDDTSGDWVFVENSQEGGTTYTETTSIQARYSAKLYVEKGNEYVAMTDKRLFLKNGEWEADSSATVRPGDKIKVELKVQLPDTDISENNRDIIVIGIKEANSEMPYYFLVYQQDQELAGEVLDPSNLKNYQQDTQWSESLTILEGFTIPEDFKGEIYLYRGVRIINQSSENTGKLVFNNIPVAFKVE